MEKDLDDSGVREEQAEEKKFNPINCPTSCCAKTKEQGMDRRNFLKHGVVGGAAGLIVSSAYASYLPSLNPTPPETEGPFYPVLAQKDKDFDLTKIEGKQGVAKGNAIIIQGQVLDTDGNPVEDVTVDLWQANAAGRYRHPHDSNEAPLDPNFQGWAIVPSGKEGKFRFRTVS
ncbi:MAG: hypothetical protein IH927_05970, partial [Proteobacteria bacterium]|nr:hypothetical protein [Pseudomonadota bacterium]